MKIKERYVNPLTDFGFKLLFGIEKNKDLLIHFLNQLLPDDFQINNLEYSQSEKLGDTAKEILGCWLNLTILTEMPAGPKGPTLPTTLMPTSMTL